MCICISWAFTIELSCVILIFFCRYRVMRCFDVFRATVEKREKIPMCPCYRRSVQTHTQLCVQYNQETTCWMPKYNWIPYKCLLNTECCLSSASNVYSALDMNEAGTLNNWSGNRKTHKHTQRTLFPALFEIHEFDSNRFIWLIMDMYREINVETHFQSLSDMPWNLLISHEIKCIPINHDVKDINIFYDWHSNWI